MLNFGLDAIVHFAEDDCRYAVVQIDISPPGDFEGHMKIVNDQYMYRFADRRLILDAVKERQPVHLDYYSLTLRCENLDRGSQFHQVSMPLNRARDIHVDSPGFVCSFSLHEMITMECKFNLIEYPATRVTEPIPVKVLALSGRKELIWTDSSMAIGKIWKGVLLTEKQRYLSYLRCNSMLSYEQFIPLLQQTSKEVPVAFANRTVSVYEDRFEIIGRRS
jgi:hypothetical protein